MRRAVQPGLVWRLYAVGLVQFALVVLSAVAIGYALSRTPQHWDIQTLSARLKPFAHDRAALAHELQELRLSEQLLVSLYDEENHLLVSNVVPALRAPRFAGSRRPQPPDGPPPDSSRPDGRPPDGRPPDGQPPDGQPPGGPPPDGRPPDSPRPDGPAEHFGGPGGGRRPPPNTFGRFEMDGHECLLVARSEHQKPSRLPLLLTMIAGLSVLGVGAFLTARWIARPLLRLSRMAQSLGQGDLRARSELSRNDEVGEVARAFDEMAERIQRLLQSEKELLANVAHELRTPLSRIRVALEIAAEGDAETARASLAEIAVDLAELETLINDVLTATRFELADGVTPNAGFALRLQALSPRLIGEAAAELFRRRHPERAFFSHFQDGSAIIDADPVLLRRVIDNLLENAHKYSPEPDSEISLKVYERGTRAGPMEAPGGVCFEVTDHGMGIAPEDLPRVFTAFFRGERSRSRGSGGVGLGLTLAKRIVEAHGGCIELESKLGQGSTVRTFLPAHAETPTVDS